MVISSEIDNETSEKMSRYRKRKEEETARLLSPNLPSSSMMVPSTSVLGTSESESATATGTDTDSDFNAPI